MVGARGVAVCGADALAASDDVDAATERPEHDPSGDRRQRTTAQMINDCFRHQHPEAYGGSPIALSTIPRELQFGRDHLVVASTGAVVAEEPMGNPESRQLD